MAMRAAALESLGPLESADGPLAAATCRWRDQDGDSQDALPGAGSIPTNAYGRWHGQATAVSGDGDAAVEVVELYRVEKAAGAWSSTFVGTTGGLGCWPAAAAAPWGKPPSTSRIRHGAEDVAAYATARSALRGKPLNRPDW